METYSPGILTTSQWLITGIDAPTCTTVVLARVVSSMPACTQIISRGTRVRDDDGTRWCTIRDDTGSATRLFADPAVDGNPVGVTEDALQANADTAVITETERTDAGVGKGQGLIVVEPPTEARRTYEFDGGQIDIAAHLVYKLDPDGTLLRVMRYTDDAAYRVRSLCPTAQARRAGTKGTSPGGDGCPSWVPGSSRAKTYGSGFRLIF